jgi:hypothetical protein
LKDGEVREKIERLKDHAGAQTQLPLLFALLARAGWFAAFNGHAADRDTPGISDLKLVQTTEERALAAATRADKDHGFTALLGMVDTVKNAVRVIGLNELFDGNHFREWSDGVLDWWSDGVLE